MIEKINIKLSVSEMNGLIGRIAEQIAISHIVQNHKQIVHEIYPDIQEQSVVQIYNTYATEFREMTIGHIGMKYRKKVIYGWYGDLVLIINSKEHGKRAIIFEVKYGNSKFTNGQKEFFRKVANEGHPSNYMPKLEELKIFIVRMSNFSILDKGIDMEIIPYLNEKEWNGRAFRIGLDKLNE